ncbi:MAG: D-tyrosyl-tRNA(Tyr) deacylase [Candidatus Gastranaerophilales bacterium]|nr:D-tyrosyl-tRNA(Tyr) deacylase [Candidatus Gastranaerophilales bacterium]
MKGLIQRVKKASVTIDNELYSGINQGILVFLGVEKGDSEQNAVKLADKICKLRIFEDENGKMNKSVTDINGEILVVSQFTLAGDCKKGTRPSFDSAEEPQKANRLYEYFTDLIRQSGINTGTGVFGAMMDVVLINDGPVTFMLEF